jgi:hypothetical protein
VLIGKEGSMATKLGADECSDRLQTAKGGFNLRSRADTSGFSLARPWRTMIRIRGTFAPQPGGGTLVNYRIEFPPALFGVFVISAPLSLLVIGGIFWLAHQSLWELWPLITISAFVFGTNLWIANRHVHWLVRFISRQLEAS